MRVHVIGRFLGVLVWLVGVVATYLPLAASYKGWDMCGIAWQIWAMIGVTILNLVWISVVVYLYTTVIRLTNADAKQARHIQQLQEAALQWEQDEHEGKHQIY